MSEGYEGPSMMTGSDAGPISPEGELRGITNAVPALISFFDRDLVCRFANGFHAEWYGGSAESIVGVHMRDFMGDIRFESRRDFIMRAMAGEQVGFDATVPHRDGSIREAAVRYIPKLDEHGVVVGFYAMTFDVTDRARAERALEEQAEMLRRQVRHRERAEDQLRQLNETLEARVASEIEHRRKTEAALLRSQKMEAIGQLTGGIAHDFNNLLQVISSNLQLLEIDLAGDARARRRITAALDGVARGSRLASQLLAFGRRQALAPKVLNIAQLIHDMEDMLGSAIGSDIRVEVDKAPDLWNSFIDPAQLENVLLNLTINARDAMNGHGTLSVRLANAILDEAYAAQHEDVAPGEYVMLALGDTGCGMTPEVMEKVFEPFFTTKPEHKGTGLGLSMVYGFVKQSGGHVNIESMVGVGTTIRLYLPRAKALETAEPVVEAGPVAGGSETILLVEDDADVRVAAVEMLQGLGYRVLKAADAESGLAVVESGIPIDLLFSDVIMPGELSAAELARRARDHLPGIAVLFTSGYTENAICVEGRLDAGTHLLTKPYTREMLARKVRKVLDAKAAGTPPPEDRALSILLVEDDATIRSYTAELLVSAGHRVHEAGCAEDALPFLAADAVDVLVTDVNLPGMSGRALARRAREIRAETGIIFATGDGHTPVEEDGATLLRKPYRLSALAEAVRMVAAVA